MEELKYHFITKEFYTYVLGEIMLAVSNYDAKILQETKKCYITAKKVLWQVMSKSKNVTKLHGKIEQGNDNFPNDIYN